MKKSLSNELSFIICKHDLEEYLVKMTKTDKTEEILGCIVASNLSDLIALHKKLKMKIAMMHDLKHHALQKLKKVTDATARIKMKKAENITEVKQKEQSIKGYVVRVTYEAISEEEMKAKRQFVANVILDSMLRKKRQST